ncbi:MAG TPA: class I SAM-dependent methyltransferase, partial [Caulobacteraceae bacterium]
MTDTPNAEQVGLWNEAMGRTWAMLHERLDRQLDPIGRAAMQKAGFKAGDAVLDVGCGCGETSLEIAGRIAPGEVLGLDASAMLLDIAREAAAAKGVANASFVQADGQVWSAPHQFDVLFSRFGVMFFENPEAAFTNLRRALKPGGRLDFACWRQPKDNLWLALPMQATKHLLPPLPPGDPNAPGPFAFADRDR